MCRGPIRPHGVDCGAGDVIAEVRRKSKRITGIRRASYRSNDPHKEWTVVPAKEEVV